MKHTNGARLRNQPMDQVVFGPLDADGGPLISHGASEEQQRSFDATCRQLHRFLRGRNGSSA